MRHIHKRIKSAVTQVTQGVIFVHFMKMQHLLHVCPSLRTLSILLRFQGISKRTGLAFIPAMKTNVALKFSHKWYKEVRQSCSPSVLSLLADRVKEPNVYEHATYLILPQYHSLRLLWRFYQESFVELVQSQVKPSHNTRHEMMGGGEWRVT